MEFHTSYGSFFKVEEVNRNLFRVFYVHKGKKKLISSRDTHKAACKLAKQFKDIYNMGYYDGTDW